MHRRTFRLTHVIGAAVCLCSALIVAQTQTRNRAEYTRMYSDDIETTYPALGKGFVLGPAGSLTEAATEVISGRRSIRGAYDGTASYNAFLYTDPAVIPLTPNRPYRVTFRYRILTAPSHGFELLFYSPAGGNAGNWLPSLRTNGVAGDTGTGSLTGTLGPYTDYRAHWTINGTGAVAIDDIQITDVSTGKLVASELGESFTSAPGAGLQLDWGAAVTTDPAQVIAGNASVLLEKGGTLSTKPAVLSIPGNSTYVVEFQYRILNRGTEDSILHFWLLPVSNPDWATGGRLGVSVPGLLKNAAMMGTFSTGALTAEAAGYVFSIHPGNQAAVVIDNVSVFRKDVVASTALPLAWNRLATLPFPRLGNCQQNIAAWLAQTAPGEGLPYYYSVDQIERRLAFADVIAGLDPWSQTLDPASLRRIRQMNPDAVLLPYRSFLDQGVYDPAPPPNKTVDDQRRFFEGLADSWFSRDSRGNYVFDPWWQTRLMNISDACPVVGGQNYLGYLRTWVANTLFRSGLWDGIFFDWLLGGIQARMAYSDDPAVWDWDWNGDRRRDETKAMSNEMVRGAAKRMLSDLRVQAGAGQLVMGNNGARAETSLAAYVNGYLFECFDQNWRVGWLPAPSQAGWRRLWQTYRAMQENARPPRINILEGCGGDPNLAVTGLHVSPSAADLRTHRLGLGTALLHDGFYEYDLYDARSAPYWFDEFSVSELGVAREDRSGKGYLGQALAESVELAAAAALVFQEDFEASALPAWVSGNPANLSITQAKDKVIAGAGSLVVHNPDHTRLVYPGAILTSDRLKLTPGKNHLVTFDWRVLETVDTSFSANISGNGQAIDSYPTDGLVKGDSGTAQFPFTVPASGSWSLAFSLGGGGEVAIDRLRIHEGGVGAWRRDFENGFVLVNPLLQARTFTTAELAGMLKRTGIRRIKGAQAPEVNNGQAVSGVLTIAPFDAIILLADHIDAAATPPPSKPAIKPSGVISAASFGAAPTLAPATWVEIYGASLAPTTRGWATRDFSGSNAPTDLDGVGVSIGGRPAFVSYVSPTQVNALLPADVQPGLAQVIVTSPAGSSEPYLAVVDAVQPAMLAPPSFTINGKQYAAALAADMKTFLVPAGALPGVPTRPAKPGEIIVLYGIGFGPVTPAQPAGTLVSQANTLAGRFELRFGNAPATLLYSGLAPGATGLYQFNVLVPEIADNTAVPLSFSLAGAAPSQTLYIAVQR